MNKLYCGIDYHKNKSTVCIKNFSGEQLELVTVQSKRLVSYLSNKAVMLIGIEASGGTNELAGKLKALGHEVKLINPLKFRAIGIGGKKTDKRDASMLAEALRLNFIPEVHHKSDYSRRLKSLIVSREMLVRSRVNMTNHIRGTLREYGISIPQGAEAFWENVNSSIDILDCPYIKSHLLDLKDRALSLKQREQEIHGLIEQFVLNDERVSKLQTVPGIGLLTAAAFVCVLDNVSRFKNSKYFASYLGLVPREYSSGDKRRLGSITRSGSELLRRYLIHGSRSVLRHSGQLSKKTRIDVNRLWALKIKNRSGMNKAVVALAHRLARIAFSMLKDNTSYNIVELEIASVETGELSETKTNKACTTKAA